MVVNDDAGHHMFWASATAGVLVDPRDQGFDRDRAIANDLGGHPLGDGHDFSADHQDPAVATPKLRFQDDAATVPLRLLKTPTNSLGSDEVQADPPAVVAVQGLGDHGSLELR